MRFTVFTHGEACSGFDSEEHVVVYANRRRVVGEVRLPAFYGRKANRKITYHVGRFGDGRTKPEPGYAISNVVFQICGHSS